MSYSLGVDLGTTYSAAAVCEAGVARIVSLGHHAMVVPSVVFVDDNGQFLVGEPAERRSALDPSRVAREFKRRIGDPVPFVIGGTTYTAETLSAMLLRHLVEGVIEQQGRPPDQIVVTFPANWGEHKQQRLAEVVRLAAIGEAQTITEPEAAAIWYASEERVAVGERIAVYDLGGGTFDAAVLQKTHTGFAVLGTPRGIDRLGGVDFDSAIVAHVLRAINSDGSDLTTDSTMAAAHRLKAECIAAKEALSSDTSVAISVTLPGLHADVRLTRSELEDMVRPLLLETVRSLQQTIRSAGLEPADVDRVLLVGGASRMPVVSELVSQALARPSFVDAHPKHVIALGAAIAAESMSTRRPVAPAAGEVPPAPNREQWSVPPPIASGGPLAEVSPPPPIAPPPITPPPITEPVVTSGGPSAVASAAPSGEPAGVEPPGVRRKRRRVLTAVAAGVVVVAGVTAALVLLPSEGSQGTDSTASADSTAPVDSTAPAGTTALADPTARTLEIPSTQLWTDTHVDCETGDVLDIVATGTVLHNKESLESAVDPEGLTDPFFHQYNVPGLPDANTVALIGSLDREQPFVVGKGTTYECPGAGRLFLGINDVGVANNSGEFVATITQQAP